MTTSAEYAARGLDLRRSLHEVNARIDQLLEIEARGGEGDREQVRKLRLKARGLEDDIRDAEQLQQKAARVERDVAVQQQRDAYQDTLRESRDVLSGAVRDAERLDVLLDEVGPIVRRMQAAIGEASDDVLASTFGTRAHNLLVMTRNRLDEIPDLIEVRQRIVLDRGHRSDDRQLRIADRVRALVDRFLQQAESAAPRV